MADTAPNDEIPDPDEDPEESTTEAEQPAPSLKDGRRDGRTEAEWAEVNERTKTDRNFLLPCELKALADLKENYAIANDPYFNDKTLLVFLFARKLDLERTAQLLTGHLKWRKDHGMLAPRRLADVDQKMLNAQYSWTVEGVRDKAGRGIMYIFLNRFIAADYADDAILQHSIWSFEQLCEHETLDCHRKGFTVIESIAGISLRKNLAGGRMKKVADDFMKTGLQYFPMRLASILVVEPGKIIKVLLKIAKFFVKTKLLKRVECVTRAELIDKVGSQGIIKDFGGTCQFNYADYLTNMQRRDMLKTDESKVERKE